MSGFLGLAALILAAGAAQAQKFPSRAIQFLVPLAGIVPQ
jgi:tripartite-type tricarboxylate transporter receptor subunit TctC